VNLDLLCSWDAGIVCSLGIQTKRAPITIFRAIAQRDSNQRLSNRGSRREPRQGFLSGLASTHEVIMPIFFTLIATPISSLTFPIAFSNGSLASHRLPHMNTFLTHLVSPETDTIVRTDFLKKIQTSNKSSMTDSSRNPQTAQMPPPRTKRTVHLLNLLNLLPARLGLSPHARPMQPSPSAQQTSTPILRLHLRIDRQPRSTAMARLS
jgi:hypothetical protein